MSKITGFKCDECGGVFNNSYEVIGIKKEHSVFETEWIFDTKGAEKCSIHVCINCVQDKIDAPVAYLKGKDPKQWEIKRAELSTLLRFSIVNRIEKDKKGVAKLK